MSRVGAAPCTSSPSTRNRMNDLPLLPSSTMGLWRLWGRREPRSKRLVMNDSRIILLVTEALRRSGRRNPPAHSGRGAL